MEGKNGEVGLIFLAVVAIVIILLAFGLIHFKMNATSPAGTNSSLGSGPSNPNVPLAPGPVPFDEYLENKLSRGIYPQDFSPTTNVELNVGGDNNTVIGESDQYTIPLFGVVGMQAGL